jgi:hypothetical protein
LHKPTQVFETDTILTHFKDTHTVTAALNSKFTLTLGKKRCAQSLTLYQKRREGQ